MLHSRIGKVWVLNTQASKKYQQSIEANYRWSTEISDVYSPVGLNVMSRTSPLESLTFRSKDTPYLKPTGRYKENSGEVVSVLAANQINQQLDEDEGDVRALRKDEQEKYDNEDDYQDEEELETADEAKQALIQKMQSAKRHTYQATINDQILFEYINFIDIEGKYHPNVKLSDILESFVKEKAKYTLVLVEPQTATCRMMHTKEFAEHSKNARLTALQNRVSLKQIQLTWNIGDNDLMYRLRRAAKSLEEGCRLDIILGARKSKLTRDRAQREEMLANIRKVLGPYGYEWKKMSGGFPNAELWFQGYSEKMKKSRAIEAAAKEARELMKTTREIEERAVGSDEFNLSDEEYQPGSFKVRSRLDVLAEADAEYAKLFPDQAKGFAIENFWEDLAKGNPGAPSASKRNKATQKPHPSTDARNEKKQKTTPADDVKAEFEEIRDPEKLHQQAEAQAELQAMATQFANIGSKSIFGRKLSRR